MVKRLPDEITEIEGTKELKKVKKEKKEKKEKKDKKERKDKKDRKEKRNKDIELTITSNNDGSKDDKSLDQSQPIKSLAVYDINNIMYSVSVVQEHLSRLLKLSLTTDELSKFINHLIENNNSPDATAKLLLLSKNQKIQLASQIKTLYNENKLKIFDQIMNFSDNSVLESAENIQLLIKKRNEKKNNVEFDNNDNNNNGNIHHNDRFLPALPTLNDSILEAKVFIHRSVTNNDMHSSKYDQVQSNNERLEYLGDAVLETIVSDILYNRYSDYDEGELTILRATLVKNETIEILARAYKFPERQKELLDSNIIDTDLTAGRGGVNKHYADLFESYIGALFIDKGNDGGAYEFIKNWLITLYTPILTEHDECKQSRYVHLSNQLVKKYLTNPYTYHNKKIIFNNNEQQKETTIEKNESKVEKIEENNKDKKEIKEEKIEESSTKVTMGKSEEKFEKFPVTIKSEATVDKLAKGELYSLIGTANSHPIYRTDNNRSKRQDSYFVVHCVMENEILGTGEGKSTKDASARAAKAALLNKKAIEKYHLIRMMTPREESIQSQLKPEKIRKNTYGFVIPYKIQRSEIPTPDLSAKTKLLEILSDFKIIPEYIVEPDPTVESVLPMFRTTLKIKDRIICNCVEASKKKGANKVSQWLLDEIERNGKDKVFKILHII